MQTETAKPQERTDDRIRQRARWESFAFAVPEPGQVTVTNHSYGLEADQHRYTVTVEDGESVACSCPFFEHHEQTCKHQVAVQDQPAVIAAASMITDQDEEAHAQAGGASLNDSGECVNGDPLCPGPDGIDLPCFDCFTLTEVH